MKFMLSEDTIEIIKSVAPFIIGFGLGWFVRVIEDKIKTKKENEVV